MIEDEEWEVWDSSKMTFLHHMIAGSIAGLAEHVSVFPLDTIKTHIQCERCGSVSPIQTWNCAARIVNNEGVFRLWRGVSAMFAGCIPGKII
jgi:solute carrier family 25 iron transporter 28/37